MLCGSYSSTKSARSVVPPEERGLRPKCPVTLGLFLAEGHLAYLQIGQFGIKQVSLVNGNWITTETNSSPIPRFRPTWDVDGTTVETLAGTRGMEPLQIVRDGSNIHLFALFGQTLLHRANVKLKTVSPAAEQARVDVPAVFTPVVSALEPDNTPFEASEWAVLTTNLPVPVVLKPLPAGLAALERQKWYSFILNGTPAVIVIDDSTASRPRGRAFRRVADQWSEFADCSFAFGTEQYSLVTGPGSGSTHLMTATSLGGWHCYRLDPNGFHREQASGPFDGLQPSFERERGWLWEIIRNALIATLILGAVASLLMRFATKPVYEFGHARVRLASLWRRGLARGVDLGLVGLSSVPLEMVSLSWIDWPAWLEALNLRLDHPSLDHVRWLILAHVAWVLAIIALLGFVQGSTGVTPGKWLCGLRVLRTTLKPCGMARGMVREIVLFVDSSYLFCWTPGIVSIALTNRRQRLGDLVADTLVVESRSLR